MAQGKKRTQKEREDLVKSLIPIIQITGSCKKACIQRGIPFQSIVDIRNKDELLRFKIKEAENFRQLLAEKVVIKSVQEGNTLDAKWLLERVDKNTYSTKTETKAEVNLIHEANPVDVNFLAMKEKKVKKK